MLKDLKRQPVVITEGIYELLLKRKEPIGLIALYNIYYLDACQQSNHRAKIKVREAAKLLKVTAERIRRWRRVLIKLGLIEEVQERSKKGGFASKEIIVRFEDVTGLRSNRSPALLCSSNILLRSSNNNSHMRILRKSTRASENELLNIEDDFDLVCARRLLRFIEEENVLSRKSKLASWVKEIRHIRDKQGYTKKQIKTILKWYILNYTKKYTPKIYKVKDLTDKWKRIEAAKERDELGGKSKSSKQVKKVKGKRTVILTYGNDEDE